ncbi:hypothetical protein FDECE_12749 [Fusarium decemcellulare]|nr:hypothetical protein FDECE_12749 [Fusarium decemcellulare]
MVSITQRTTKGVVGLASSSLTRAIRYTGLRYLSRCLTPPPPRLRDTMPVPGAANSRGTINYKLKSLENCCNKASATKKVSQRAVEAILKVVERPRKRIRKMEDDYGCLRQLSGANLTVTGST